MIFAEKYPKTEQGWIKYPDDRSLRDTLFHPDATSHPAKANIYMIADIVDYVSKPGETILDIMSGTGTIMIAALRHRKVICIELEPFYYPWLDEAKKRITGTMTLPESNILILHGDCRKFLPLPVNHIVFSPPYASIMVRKSAPKAGSDIQLAGGKKLASALPEYSHSQGNVGLLGRFLYNHEMEKIYKLCYQSLPVGGTLTVILEDYTDAGKRVYLSDWMLKACVRAGFYVKNRFKRYCPGSGYKKLWKSKGLDVVEDEDIMVFNKKGEDE